MVPWVSVASAKVAEALGQLHLQNHKRVFAGLLSIVPRTAEEVLGSAVESTQYLEKFGRRTQYVHGIVT